MGRKAKTDGEIAKTADLGGLTVGMRLTMVRESLKLSRKEAAERAGLNYSFWSDVEGDRRSPTLDTLWQIAQRLGVDPNQIDPRFASTAAGPSQTEEIEAKAQAIGEALAKAALDAALQAANKAATEKLGIAPKTKVEPKDEP